MAEIALKLKRPPVVPDFETCVSVVYEDTGNPLDSGEFPEIPIRIEIPEGTVITSEYVISVMTQALELAKTDAQVKANKRELQAAMNPLLLDYAENAPETLFTGNVETVTEYTQKISDLQL